MKLIEVKIHNFRGIIDTKVTFQSYALLVGANNAGKTTIIDAIRAFYEKDGFKFKKESDFPLKDAIDDESWIDVHFSLTDHEHESLKKEYQTEKKQLRVRKYFQTSHKMQDGKNASGSILGYKSNGELSNESFYGAKNVQSGKFGDLIYIPAVSKVDEYTKLSGPSALRDLVANIMSDVVESSPAYHSLTESVQSFASDIRTVETNDKRSLSGFEQDLNLMLGAWQAQFMLRFTVPSTAEIIKSMLGWDIQDENHEAAHGIEYFGSGFQRHFIYSLIQLGAKYVPKKPLNKTKDFTPSLNLVLFEEPEAFLHPPQQDELARSLMKISFDHDWQVICSTHSSHFVSRNSASIPAIIRTQRKNGLVSTFQIDEVSWQSIIDSNHTIQHVAAKYPRLQKKMQADDLKPEMESIKYFLWLNSERAGLFFADRVLLVEGPSETALISKLLDEGKLSLPSGTYVLDGLGKYNIHRFMNLLSGLGIIHSVLHDDDENKNEHMELNQLIANSATTGITVAIKQITKDLETYLNVPDPGDKHRKPQHLLYCYAMNQIDSKKVDGFCSLVESCLPSKQITLEQ